jgi:hypothetical protein
LKIVLRKNDSKNEKPLLNKKDNVSESYMPSDSACFTGLENCLVYQKGSPHEIKYGNLSPDTFYSLDIYDITKSGYELKSEIKFTTLAQIPDIQTKRIMWGEIKKNSFDLYANGGSGSKALVVVSKSINDFVPVAGVHYYADKNFGKGQEVSQGVFAVLSSTDSLKSVVVENLESGSTYYIKSFEFNGIDKSCNYNTDVKVLKNAIKLTTQLEAPSLLFIKKVGLNNISVGWNKVNGAENYEVEIANDSLFLKPNEIYGNVDVGNILEYLFEELPENAEYFVRVRALGESSVSVYSNSLSKKL